MRLLAYSSAMLFRSWRIAVGWRKATSKVLTKVDLISEAMPIHTTAGSLFDVFGIYNTYVKHSKDAYQKVPTLLV